MDRARCARRGQARMPASSRPGPGRGRHPGRGPGRGQGGAACRIDAALARVSGIEPLFPLVFMTTRTTTRSCGTSAGAFHVVGGAPKPGSAVIIRTWSSPTHLAEGTWNSAPHGRHGFPRASFSATPWRATCPSSSASPDFADPVSVPTTKSSSRRHDRSSAATTGRSRANTARPQHGPVREMVGQDRLCPDARLKRAFDPHNLLNPA